MTSNPYARKFGASAREQKRQAEQQQDLYTFNPSAAANDLIAATIGAAQHNNAGGGGGGNAFGYDGFMPPPTGAPLASQRQPTQGGMMSGPVGPGGFDGPRPMTSAKGAGYTSVQKKPNALFDPLGQASTHGPAPPLQQRSQDSPEYQAKDMEKAVNRLIEESAFAQQAKNAVLALDKAKEAGKLERALCKHREKHGLADQINFDLTYAVCFNLANCYAAARMYTEALGAYALVVKNKQYPQAGRLRVNMGNIYFAQKKYPAAIKMYRMAMDQIGALSKEMKWKMMRNIGIAFVKLGQFQDAIHSFQAIMEQQPDPQTGFNLLVCFYALGEKEKMRRAFIALLACPEYAQQEKEDEEEAEAELAALQAAAQAKKAGSAAGAAGAGASSSAVPSATPPAKAPSSVLQDELRAERKQRRKVTHRYLHMAARLIAPVIEKDLAAGFDWVIQHLKAPRAGGAHAARSAQDATPTTVVKQGFPSIAMDIEIAKGITFLKGRKYRQAIDVFKSFEKNHDAASTGSGVGTHGGSILDQAATNLSFLYFLEGDLKASARYADLAVRSDRYNAKALVNKANFLFCRGTGQMQQQAGPGGAGGAQPPNPNDLEQAKELYLEAIGVEADCIEAIYNLGLTNKRLGAYKDALQAFKKLHRILPKDTQVIWHMANLHETLGDTQEALQLFTTLHGMVPTDARVLARLGTLYTKEDDETSAFHNFHDSYQLYPIQMEVISWLGVWYVKSGLYEDAIQYFERAAQIEPQEIKWQLMVASCYRRMNEMKSALRLYKKIHKQEPENIECLRYLCTITKDTSEREYEEYTRLLKKAERAAQQREEAALNGGQQAYMHMRNDVQAEQYHPAPSDGEPVPRAPDVSPGATARRLDQSGGNGVDRQRSVVNLADGFRPELSPQKQGPTFASGNGAQQDEWGEGLADELLP